MNKHVALFRIEGNGYAELVYEGYHATKEELWDEIGRGFNIKECDIFIEGMLYDFEALGEDLEEVVE